MIRYFLKLSYNGSDFFGWQIQPNDITVQETIEKAISKLSNQHINVVGCGRTDARVHASEYYAHIDLPKAWEDTEQLRYKLNLMIPHTINIADIILVSPEAHARFDATQRSYVYKMNFVRDPFQQNTIFKFNQPGRPDIKLMNDLSSLFLEYKSFFSFCKTNSDVDHYLCNISEFHWEVISETEWHFHITSNRFLRGMVRLIVGTCINVGLGRVSEDEVHSALKNQERLIRAWAVPPEGLYLSKIKYPYID